MFDRFVGIPFLNKGVAFDGCDCFGLVRLLYGVELGQEIPNPSYENAVDSKQIHSEYIKQIATNWKEVKELKKYDVIAMAHDARHPHIIQHFGIYLGNDKMLHTLRNVGSHIVDISQYQYYIKGFYRWQKS